MKKLFMILPLVFQLCLTFGCQKAEEVAEIEKEITVETGYAEVNNTRLYYEYAGSGDAILLIHGNGGPIGRVITSLASSVVVLGLLIYGWFKTRAMWGRC